MKRHLIANFACSLVALIALSGCTTHPRQAIMVGGGSAGGSAIGGAIDDSPAGYAIGALVGGASGLVTSNYLDEKDGAAMKEAYERGRRDESVENMNDLWSSRTNPKESLSSVQSATGVESGGYYNGVGYLPRPSQTKPYQLYDPAR